MHGGEVPLVHRLDARDLVEVVGAERAKPRQGTRRQVAQWAVRTSGAARRRGNCLRAGS